MKVLRTIAEVRRELQPLRSSGSVGFVPTMGALHIGHESLIHASVAQCDRTIVSIFVNPKQFNEASDLAAYPRDEEGDLEKCKAAGADFVFLPSVEEIYPEGYSTIVSVPALSRGYEGAERPGHFDAVCTVVARLLNIVNPSVLFLGQKDAQQVAVLSRMISDLAMPIDVKVSQTIRDPDGMACSSRNVHLSPAGRERATSIYAALQAVTSRLENGAPAGEALQAGHAILSAAGIEPEYLDLLNPLTFEPLSTLEDEAVVVVAARVEGTRLIDNVTFTPSSSPQRARRDDVVSTAG